MRKTTHRRVVEDVEIVEIEQSENLAARDRGQSVFGVRERELEREEIDHLRQRQRDHREVESLAADRDEAEQQAERRRSGVPSSAAISNGRPHSLSAWPVT